MAGGGGRLTSHDQSHQQDFLDIFRFGCCQFFLGKGDNPQYISPFFLGFELFRYC